MNHGLNHLIEKDVLIEWWDKVLPQVHKTLDFSRLYPPMWSCRPATMNPRPKPSSFKRRNWGVSFGASFSWMRPLIFVQSMFEIESAKTRFQGISKHLFSLLFLVFSRIIGDSYRVHLFCINLALRICFRLHKIAAPLHDDLASSTSFQHVFD